MYTLQQTLNDQVDLKKLCADRPLKTKEIIKQNAFYGIDRIIKRYAGLPHSYSIKAHIPHGITYTDYVSPSEKYAPVPAIFCYMNYKIPAYRKKTDKVVFPFCFPFLYIGTFIRKDFVRERKGTICFPGHSSSLTTVENDFNAIANTLSALPSEFHPLTVCLYWREYEERTHSIFKAKGINVVSAGHFHDPLFSYRLYHLLSTHKYATSNMIGTSLFLAASVGCRFFFLQNLAPKITDLSVDWYQAPDNEQEKNLFTAFATPNHHGTIKQKHILNSYLGRNHKLSRLGMLKLLFYAEILDKTKPMSIDETDKRKLPEFYARTRRRFWKMHARKKREKGPL